MSFRIAAAIMVLSSTAALAPAWGQGRDLGTGAMARPGDYSFSGGAAVYSHVCQACHMPDGKGAVGAGAFPSLAANPKLEAAAYPVALILNGSKAMLPLSVMKSYTVSCTWPEARVRLPRLPLVCWSSGRSP